MRTLIERVKKKSFQLCFLLNFRSNVHQLTASQSGDEPKCIIMNEIKVFHFFFMEDKEEFVFILHSIQSLLLDEISHASNLVFIFDL